MKTLYAALLISLLPGCGSKKNETGYCEFEANGVEVCVFILRDECLELFEGASSSSAQGVENPACTDFGYVDCSGQVTDLDGGSHGFSANSDEDCALAAGESE